ncbi:ABC transporter ATP-binding protein [Anaerorhabdus sp.]|uniref:ABC transporter ATP-binding protein n=1 Tax=Anaerorhabdus sp. TaxID=1872524 RepID=UPI002FC7CC63
MIQQQIPIIQLDHIIKRYFVGKPNELEILHGLDLKIYPGEFVAIVGESGSGKSTLMNIIGALDRPTEGEYTLDNIQISKVKDNEISHIRCAKIGFIFQTFNLIGKLSALKNVQLPMLYAGMSKKESNKRAQELLELVGMKDRMKHQPNELSGGQKQRVAIARAISNNPTLLLADEPTGALDSSTSRSIMDLFHKLHKEKNMSIVLITHSQELAKETDRIITLKDGRIINDCIGEGAHEHLG